MLLIYFDIDEDIFEGDDISLMVCVGSAEGYIMETDGVEVNFKTESVIPKEALIDEIKVQIYDSDRMVRIISNYDIIREGDAAVLERHEYILQQLNKLLKEAEEVSEDDYDAIRTIYDTFSEL